MPNEEVNNNSCGDPWYRDRLTWFVHVSDLRLSSGEKHPSIIFIYISPSLCGSQRFWDQSQMTLARKTGTQRTGCQSIRGWYMEAYNNLRLQSTEGQFRATRVGGRTMRGEQEYIPPERLWRVTLQGRLPLNVSCFILLFLMLNLELELTSDSEMVICNIKKKEFCFYIFHLCSLFFHLNLHKPINKPSSCGVQQIFMSGAGCERFWWSMFLLGLMSMMSLRSRISNRSSCGTTVW